MITPASIDAVTARTAIERNRGSDRILVVTASARWSQPCHIMEQTALRDARVTAWTAAHGEMLQLDVEADRELAELLRIRTLPCIIAFKDGREFDRITGMRDAGALLGWLADVATGWTEAARLRASASEPGAMGARFELAQHLADIGRHDEAAEEYAWLWEHMLEHDPSMAGVRGSFFARQVKLLVFAHAGARRRFQAFRDAIDVRSFDVVTDRTLGDWLILNAILSDDAATLAWFDAVKHDLRWSPLLDRHEHHLGTLLLGEGRWEDAGLLYADPMAHLRQRRDLLNHARHFSVVTGKQSMEHVAVKMFRMSVAQLHAALESAGRDDARRFADELRTIDASPEMEAALLEMHTAAREGRGVKRI